MESSSTGAKKINHKKQEKYSSGHFQTHLALALDRGPELAELREVDALVAVLVRLMDETLSLALSHGPADLLHELPKFVLGDHAVTIHVEQLKSLEEML